MYRHREENYCEAVFDEAILLASDWKSVRNCNTNTINIFFTIDKTLIVIEDCFVIPRYACIPRNENRYFI